VCWGIWSPQAIEHGVQTPDASPITYRVYEVYVKRKKDENERRIFRHFVRAAELSINPRSVRSLRPPRPDISCRLNGSPHYFELTRMVHHDSANAMGHHLSQLTRTGSAPPLGADIYSDRGALRETIERKASKKYQTSGRPVALLIYIDGVFHPPKMPSSWAQTILGEEGPKRHWAGIWLYDAVYNRIIANWLRE
jgi:hypothetical protein